MGRPRRALRNRLNPFAKLDSEWKAREAAEAASGAAALIAFSHVLSAVVRFNDQPYPALISSSPAALGTFNAMLAVIAAVAGYVAYRRRPYWVAWILLGWAVLDVLPWITGPLYGHAVKIQLNYLALMFGVIGVRGVVALKKGFSPDAKALA